MVGTGCFSLCFYTEKLCKFASYIDETRQVTIFLILFVLFCNFILFALHLVFISNCLKIILFTQIARRVLLSKLPLSIPQK